MAVGPTEEWFSLSIRRNRKSFMLAWLLVIVIIVSVTGVLLYFQSTSGAGKLIFALFNLPAIVCGYTLTAQRLRDFGVTGWMALLWIPVGIADNYLGGAATAAFSLALCAIPGTIGENRYGADPLST